MVSNPKQDSDRIHQYARQQDLNWFLSGMSLYANATDTKKVTRKNIGQTSPVTKS